MRQIYDDILKAKSNNNKTMFIPSNLFQKMTLI